jgi:hypothetical protein
LSAIYVELIILLNKNYFTLRVALLILVFNYSVFVAQQIVLYPFTGLTKGFSEIRSRSNSWCKINGNHISDMVLNPLDYGIQLEFTQKKLSFITGFQSGSSQISTRIDTKYDFPITSDSTFYETGSRSEYISKVRYLVIPLLLGVNIHRQEFTNSKRRTYEKSKIKLFGGVTLARQYSPFYIGEVFYAVTYLTEMDSIGSYTIISRQKNFNICIHARIDFLISIKKTPICYFALTINKGLIPQVQGEIVAFKNEHIIKTSFRDYGDYINFSLRFPIRLRPLKNELKSNNQERKSSA